MSNNVGISFSSTSNGNSGYTTGGIGGFEFLIPGLGRNIYVNNNPTLGPLLGGGFRGRMPQPLVIHDNTNNFSQTRLTLREVWNTTSKSGSSNPKRIITPFRAVNNAGDLLSRENYSCGGTCQTYQSRPNVKGLKHRFGSIGDSCQPSVLWSLNQVDSNIPASACNTKFVYDSSDYIRYLKNQAVNKNYNDRSFGGNDSSAQQSNIRSIRRY